MKIHQLEPQKHEKFLSQKRIDPITGDMLQAGDEVVICAACKSAFHIDSWRYLGERHCNQTSTLPTIPQTVSLGKLEKRPASYYERRKRFSVSSNQFLASSGQRISAFLIDFFIVWIAQKFVFDAISQMVWFYFLFRDVTINGVYLSVGKNIFNIHTVEEHTGSPIKWWQSVLRNAPVGIPQTIRMVGGWFYTTNYQIWESISVIDKLSTIILSIVFLIDIFLVFSNNKRLMDRLIHLKNSRRQRRN